MDDEYMEVELLEDYMEALLGAVYDDDGNPVPAYSSQMVLDKLIAEGMTEDQAVEYIEFETEGMRILWIHALEIDPTFTPERKKPNLRLVH
jgi:hypothetical protein